MCKKWHAVIYCLSWTWHGVMCDPYFTDWLSSLFISLIFIFYFKFCCVWGNISPFLNHGSLWTLFNVYREWYCRCFVEKFFFFFLNNNSDIYFARHVFWIIKTATTSRYTLIIGQSLITLVDYLPFVSFWCQKGR